MQRSLYIDDPQYHQQYLRSAETCISRLLEGSTPRLIDEWQLIPQLWDAIRFTVDHRPGKGQFILTGSSVPPPEHQAIHHSGTGRFSWVRMRPMTLYESGESNGSVSLTTLFDTHTPPEGINTLSLDQLAFITCRGGWPQAVLSKNDKAALLQAEEYYEAITHSDISRVDNVSRDPSRTQRLLRSYARHQGTQASIATIVNDLAANAPNSLSDVTVNDYLQALRRIFVIEDLPAWSPNLRSRTAIRTADTRYFIDPSIACAALGLGPKDLMDDLRTFGFFFETLALRDLRVYSDVLRGNVYHYRDKNGLECDAVVHLRNGSYGLIEIKLGGDTLIEEGAKNLHALAAKIDTQRMKAPSFLMVLTATGPYAYRRKDGICIVPIGCLKD